MNFSHLDEKPDTIFLNIKLIHQNLSMQRLTCQPLFHLSSKFVLNSKRKPKIFSRGIIVTESEIIKIVKYVLFRL